MIDFTESTVEDAALAWLEAIGWQVAHGPEIAPDMPAAERADYGEVVLTPPCATLCSGAHLRRTAGEGREEVSVGG